MLCISQQAGCSVVHNPKKKNAMTLQSFNLMLYGKAFKLDLLVCFLIFSHRLQTLQQHRNSFGFSKNCFVALKKPKTTTKNYLQIFKPRGSGNPSGLVR